MESEIMIQIVPAGYHIRHISCPFSPDLFLSLCGYCVGHLKKGKRGWLKIKRFLNQDDYFSPQQHEGSILSLVLQLMPSLQTQCFVQRLLNCKSEFKISLSMDNQGYISHLCTFYCPRQNSRHNNKIDCSSLIFIWSNTFYNSAFSRHISMMYSKFNHV